MAPEAAAPGEGALRRFVAHRTMLKAYVLAIVRDGHLAEDTLSDVAVELARSAAGFDASRPFAPWARGVARRVALANLRRQLSGPQVLDAEALEAVGAEIDSLGDEARLEAQKDALRRCLEALPEAHRRMVRLRYDEQRPLAQVAEAMNRSLNSIYVTFSGIHRRLMECVRAKTGASQ